jgi:hypothetical protein
MASSRWKRFAFFERHTLSLASEVLEDLIPIGGSEGKGSRRSLNNNDSASLVMTTAALPLNSKPVDNVGNSNGVEATALTNMWSSLNACTVMELPGTEDDAIRLPSQAQFFEDDRNVNSSGAAVDGLVLVFVTSQGTDYVHCFDVTVRCNPPDSAEKDLEDLDGWRGYIAPLKRQKSKPSQPGANLEDRIISEHMEQETTDGIVGIATCRATSGHRPLHMACITATDVVVCIDPHLYLSW